MADKLVPSQDDTGAVRRFRDMADGTFAEVVSVAAGAVGAAGYPAGATPIAVTSGNATNATATATLPAAVGKTTYITGFAVTGGGATAGQLAGVTVTGVPGGPLNYTVASPTGITNPLQPLIINFSPPLPATALNTAIAVSVAALGAGNVSSNVTATGFQL